VATPKSKPASRTSDDTTGEELNFRMLCDAYNGQTSNVIAALSEGAGVAAKHKETGLTALHIAIGTNNLSLTRALVETWNAPIEPDERGRWPTIIASECRVSDELSDYILEKEAEALGNTE
jgi:hypothetical protein